jgi:hypothetical protein
MQTVQLAGSWCAASPGCHLPMHLSQMPRCLTLAPSMRQRYWVEVPWLRTKTQSSPKIRGLPAPLTCHSPRGCSRACRSRSSHIPRGCSPPCKPPVTFGQLACLLQHLTTVDAPTLCAHGANSKRVIDFNIAGVICALASARACPVALAIRTRQTLQPLLLLCQRLSAASITEALRTQRHHYIHALSE